MNYFILQKQVLLLWCIVVITEHVLFFLVSVSYSTRRMPLVEQELSALPEHLSSLLIFSGVRSTRSLVLCVCFVERCCLCPFVWPLCYLFFDLRLLITPLVSSNTSKTIPVSFAHTIVFLYYLRLPFKCDC